jgi:hypothetical protein
LVPVRKRNMLVVVLAQEYLSFSFKPFVVVGTYLS